MGRRVQRRRCVGLRPGAVRCLYFASIAVVMTGCGGAGPAPAEPVQDRAEEPGSPVEMIASPAPRRMTLRCEAGFNPTPYLLGRNWRRHAVRLGPVALLRARDLDSPKVDGGRRPIAFKQPFIVEPGARGMLGIRLGAGAEGGFAPLEAIANGRKPDVVNTTQRAAVEGCDKFVGRIAFGHALVLSSATCAEITYKPRRGPAIRRTVAIGRRHCRPRTQP